MIRVLGGAIQRTKKSMKPMNFRKFAPSKAPYNVKMVSVPSYGRHRRSSHDPEERYDPVKRLNSILLAAVFALGTFLPGFATVGLFGVNNAHGAAGKDKKTKTSGKKAKIGGKKTKIGGKKLRVRRLKNLGSFSIQDLSAGGSKKTGVKQKKKAVGGTGKKKAKKVDGKLKNLKKLQNLKKVKSLKKGTSGTKNSKKKIVKKSDK